MRWHELFLAVIMCKMSQQARCIGRSARHFYCLFVFLVGTCLPDFYIADV